MQIVAARLVIAPTSGIDDCGRGRALGLEFADAAIPIEAGETCTEPPPPPFVYTRLLSNPLYTASVSGAFHTPAGVTVTPSMRKANAGTPKASAFGTITFAC